MGQKLNFEPTPTFKLTIEIPVAGQDEGGELTMTFNRLKPDDFSKIHNDALNDMSAAAKNGEVETARDVMIVALQSVATGWAWKQPFDADNISATLGNYPAFFSAVMQQYAAEMWKMRAKR